MDNEYYALTETGRKMGYVLLALYRANKFLSIQELVQLSGQDEDIVNKALSMFQEFGEIVHSADDVKYGLIPEARFLIRNIEIGMGKEL